MAAAAVDRHYDSLVRTFLGDRLPSNTVVVRPDLVVYTWASVYDADIPADYVDKLLWQAAGVLRDKAQLLLYSHVGIGREREAAMIRPFADSPLFAVLCLEDVFPVGTYDELVGSDPVRYMRQLAMYEGSKVRDAVIAYALSNGKAAIAHKLHGDAIMYADMDIVFHRAPDRFETQYGVCSYIGISDYLLDCIKARTGLDADSTNCVQVMEALIADPPDPDVDHYRLHGHGRYVVCGYSLEHARTFRRTAGTVYDRVCDLDIFYTLTALAQLPILQDPNERRRHMAVDSTYVSFDDLPRRFSTM